MQTFKKNTYCSFCGTQFSSEQTYPKLCSNCQNTTYINPLPVAVVLVSVGDKILLIRRNIEPQKGKLALPGGFLEVNESWQEGAAREVKEETGLEILPKEVALFDVQSTPEGNVLIFGVWQGSADILEMELAENTEVTELQWVSSENEVIFAFPLHEKAVKNFWKYNVPKS
jgi:ADP-ribose pyrophosphatase YjhB (NUDIX family)